MSSPGASSICAPLTTLQQHIPALLDGLPGEVWVRWTPSIVATPAFGGDEGIVPRRLLLDAVPAEMRPHLINVALEHFDALAAANGSLTPHAVYVHLAMELAPAIAERRLATPTETSLAGELLTLLVEHGPSETALDTYRRLIEGASPLAPRAQGHLAKLDPDSVITPSLRPFRRQKNWLRRSKTST